MITFVQFCTFNSYFFAVGCRNSYSQSKTSNWDYRQPESMLNHTITHIIVKIICGWSCGVKYHVFIVYRLHGYISPCWSKFSPFSLLVMISGFLEDRNLLGESINRGWISVLYGFLLGLLELLVPPMMVFTTLNFADTLAVIVDRPGIRLLT